jgi:flagellar motor component MotA
VRSVAVSQGVGFVDSATLVGVLSGTVLIAVAIALGGDVGTFVDGPALLITFGGTLATLFIRYPMADVLSTVTVVKQAFFASVSSSTTRSWPRGSRTASTARTRSRSRPSS